MKTLTLILLLLGGFANARTDNGTLALNCAFHGGMGYMIGSMVSDKFYKSGTPIEGWQGTTEAVMCGILWSLVWNMGRPELDIRERNAQAISLQAFAQIGLRF